MRNNAIARIVIYSIVILILVGLLVFGITSSGMILRSNFGEALEHVMNVGFSFDAERISKIDIDWAAGSVILISDDLTGAYGDITLLPNGNNSEYPITYEFDGDTLKIAYTNASVGILVGSIPERDLTIYVPKRWLCEELEIDGAALKLTAENVKIGSLDVDGADCEIKLTGSVETVECDGAACSLELNCTDRPRSIDLNGAACELDLTLPADCGFQLEMNGLDCDFNSSLPCTQSGGVTSYGDKHTVITANGIACKVTIQANTAQ